MEAPYPFGISKDRAKEIIDHEARNLHGQHRNENVLYENVILLCV